MGGILLGVPKAPPLPAPLVPQPPLSASDGAQARINSIERQRRGRAGTVQTSDRGLVQLNAGTLQKKSLLGE
ncbi:MAG: hypothetical protein NUV50_05695 [Rhodospirillales bacterium]|nr:hypothetical protein [Rhodospirillales bacterium]